AWRSADPAGAALQPSIPTWPSFAPSKESHSQTAAAPAARCDAASLRPAQSIFTVCHRCGDWPEDGFLGNKLLPLSPIVYRFRSDRGQIGNLARIACPESV